MSVQQHHIFVSHSHVDNDFGTKLVQDLQRVLGDESAVWYDWLGGLHGGESWWEKIMEELKARDVFILVLSPDAMNSPWVRREINMALVENKFILPVLYRDCTIPLDVKTIQIISFLSPKTYEAAFKEVLVALGLPTETVVKLKPEKVTSSPDEPGTMLQQQIERAFAEQDWSDVIRKVNYLLKQMPGVASSGVYRMQGLALLKEGQVQRAEQALESALALVEDRQQRLTVLSDYAGLLAKQGRWHEVVQRSKEALGLVPNDPWWLAAREQAERKLRGATAVAPETVSSTQQGYKSGKKDILALALTTGLYLIVLGPVLLFVPGLQIVVVFVWPYVLGIVSVVVSKRQGFGGLIPALISGLAGGIIYFILNSTISSLSGITLQPSGIVALVLCLLIYGFLSLAGAAIYIGIKKTGVKLLKHA